MTKTEYLAALREAHGDYFLRQLQTAVPGLTWYKVSYFDAAKANEVGVNFFVRDEGGDNETVVLQGAGTPTLTDEQKATIAGVLAGDAYAGMTSAQKAAAMNAKTQRGLVPLYDVEAAFPIELAKIRHQAARAEQTDVPTDLQIVCYATAKWFDGAKHENIDFDLPHVVASIGVLLSAGIFIQETHDAILAMADNRRSLCDVHGLPVMTAALIEQAEAV